MSLVTPFMTNDHRVFYDDLCDRLADMQDNVKRATKSADVDFRMKQVVNTRGDIKKARNLIHLIKIELRGVQDPQVKKDYNEKIRQANEEIKQLANTLDIIKENPGWSPVQDEKAPLTSTSSSSSSVRGEGDVHPRPIRDPKFKARQEANLITRTQDDSLKTLKNCQIILADTERVAGDSERKLHEHTEIMEATVDDLRTLRGNINRAKKEMNAFVRRMMTDKIILVFLFLVLVALVVLVVMLVIKKFKGHANAPSPSVP